MPLTQSITITYDEKFYDRYNVDELNTVEEIAALIHKNTLEPKSIHVYVDGKYWDGYSLDVLNPKNIILVLIGHNMQKMDDVLQYELRFKF
jgi:hypothetical protein